MIILKGFFWSKKKIMNVIYLNKNLQYNEVFPDDMGNIIIPEKNIIVGFVQKGMLWALKDSEDEILTPFETFVQFNDMSVEFIQPQHFQRAQRVISLEGKIFCELKQVFTCETFASVMGGTINFFKQSLAAVEKPYTYSTIEALYDENYQPSMWGKLLVDRVKRGYVTDQVEIIPSSFATELIIQSDTSGEASYKVSRKFADGVPASASSSVLTMNPSGLHYLLWSPYRRNASNSFVGIPQSTGFEFYARTLKEENINQDKALIDFIKEDFERVELAELFPVELTQTPLTDMRLDFFSPCEWYQVLIEDEIFFTSDDPLAAPVETAMTSHRQGLNFRVNYRFVGGVNKTRALTNFQGYSFFQCP